MLDNFLAAARRRITEVSALWLLPSGPDQVHGASRTIPTAMETIAARVLRQNNRAQIYIGALRLRAASDRLKKAVKTCNFSFKYNYLENGVFGPVRAQTIIL